MLSPTEENYLKSLLYLGDEEGMVSLSELSEALGISKPTAHSMVKNLQKQGLVVYEKYRPLSLTPEGLKMAGLIVRKHRLTEMFLVEKMGFGWEEVHEIAEQIEHIQSPKFFERMDELLAHPSVDPHGSPIPDKKGAISKLEYIPLSECNPGKTYVLSALTHSSTEFLNFLNSRQLKLGSKLKLLSVEEFDRTMMVSYGGHPEESLSEKVCERLLVKDSGAG